jgi:hypothetical protein
MVSGFGQLFDSERSIRRYPGLKREFVRRDLNESARDLFDHLDRIFDILKTESWAFLTSIELDAERGRFPDVLVQHFWDETVEDTAAGERTSDDL